MDSHSIDYQKYLTDTYIKGNRNNTHNLECMVRQLQHEISHNYILIKSMSTRIQDLEFNVLMLTNKDVSNKESQIRPVNSVK